MKTADHLPTFRKKKQRKQLLRALLCFSPVVALFCLVTAVYIVSYGNSAEKDPETPGTVIRAGQDQSDQNHSNQNSIDQEYSDQGDAGPKDKNPNISSQFVDQETMQNGSVLSETQQALAVNDATDIYITPKMTYTLETYDARTDELNTEEQPIPNAMYGLNRVELEQYLINLAAVENEGLTEVQHHYEVRTFSRTAFTVRMTIAAKVPEYEVFLIAENGYLTAYTGDRTQVYEYTQIPLGDFPLEQQAMLTSGIYMKTMADYYDFLETYSS